MEKLVLTQKMLVSVKQSLIEGLTIASGSKASATYYHKGGEQMKALKKEILRMYNLSKELPLIIASQKGSTGQFVSEVLLNEFKQTLKGGACNIVNPIDWYDNGISDKAVLTALNNLGENGLPYILRLFVDLKDSKINNERSRKIILGFIWGQQNLEFYSLKYRNKIAKILRHVYGVKLTSALLSIAKKQVAINNTVLFNNVYSEQEAKIVNDCITKYFNGNATKAFKLLLFLFKKDAGVDYFEYPLLSEYQKAKVDITTVRNVPEEVLIGMVASINHPQYHSLWSTKIQREATKALIRKNVQVTSVNQQVRQTKSTAKLGVEKHVEVEKATDFMALYKTGYETSFTHEILVAIQKLAEKKKIQGFFYQSIGIIVDDSISMTGNKVESKNTPRAIADFTAKVLNVSAKDAVIVRTSDVFTDLASGFIELLKKENASNLAESGRNIPMFQISPITSAEIGANVRKLGSGVVTMAINNPIALMPQITARLLEIDTKRWLENQVLALESANIKRTKKISINA
jgi:hypothetical protein